MRHQDSLSRQALFTGHFDELGGFVGEMHGLRGKGDRVLRGLCRQRGRLRGSAFCMV